MLSFFNCFRSLKIEPEHYENDLPTQKAKVMDPKNDVTLIKVKSAVDKLREEILKERETIKKGFID